MPLVHKFKLGEELTYAYTRSERGENLPAGLGTWNFIVTEEETDLGAEYRDLVLEGVKAHGFFVYDVIGSIEHADGAGRPMRITSYMRPRPI